MSFVWTTIAVVYYSEIVLFLLLCIPLSIKWRHRIASWVASSGSLKHFRTALQVVFLVILLQFIDAMRDTLKHQQLLSHDATGSPIQKLELYMKMFRSQRNLYISGGALLLLIVMNRFYSMMSDLANFTQNKERADAVLQTQLTEKDARIQLLEAQVNQFRQEPNRIDSVRASPGLDEEEKQSTPTLVQRKNK